MANISISQLETVNTPSISDLYEIAIPDQNSTTGYASRKVTAAQIANLIATGVQFSGLDTTAKSIIAAINEAAQSGGGGVSDYEDLDNLPSINGVELIGDKTTEDLGLADIAVIGGETTPLTLSNSKLGGFNLTEVDGKMEQETTSGKNKFNYDQWNGITINNGTAVFENNGVTLTATANDCYTAYSPTGFPQDARIPISQGEQITLSWEETTNKEGNVGFFPNGLAAGYILVNNATAKSVTYTGKAGDEYVTIRFGVQNSGDTISYKNIQVETGSTATSYEKYTGGIPAPNPDFPMPIKKVTVSKAKVTGKNLVQIPNSIVTQTINGVTFTVNRNTDGEVENIAVKGTSSARADFNILSQGDLNLNSGDYICSSSVDSDNVNYIVQFSDGTWKTATNNGEEFTLSGSTNILYRIVVFSGKTVDFTVRPMIRKADIDDNTYEPYHSQTIQLTNPIDLYGNDTVKDVLFRDVDGVVKVERKYGIVDLSQLNFTLGSVQCWSLEGFSDIKVDSNTTGFVGMCSNSTIYSSNDIVDDTTIIGISASVRKTLYVRNGSTTEAPTGTLVYEKATPTTETLPTADQIALNSIPTYDTVTYLELLDSDLEADVSGDYGVSKVGGDTLLALLTAWKNERRQTAGGHVYSTEEQVVGTWIDGKPLYEKTWDFGSDVVIPTGNWTDVSIVVADWNIEKIVNTFATNDTGTMWNIFGANRDHTNVQLLHNRSAGNITVRYLTLCYTKTTD